MSVYSIIKELASTRSSNDKKAILQREVKNEDLKTFFRLALSNQIRFYQKKEISSTTERLVGIELADAMARLETNIAGRLITGNSARAYIENLLSWVTAEDEVVIKLILQKKSGCDLGSAIINKIWPKLIPEFPCLLATNFDEKLGAKLFANSETTYAQVKSDGLRVALIIDEEGGVTAYTRAGNELELYGVFDPIGNYVKGVVIDGELLTINKSTGKFNPRTTSNGICSKAIHGTMSKAESEQLHMTAWDMIPLADFKDEKCDLWYHTRMYDLQSMLRKAEQSAPLISLIETRPVKTFEEANKYYQEVQARGEEGIILKSSKMLWENKRSKLQLKMKSELVCELRVNGWLAGKGELEGNLGALQCFSEDEKVEVNMSGFSLKLRSEIYANLINLPVDYRMVVGDELKTFTAMPGDCDINIDTIISVKYNAKIKARDCTVYSLFLPRFECTRPDKTVANKLEEIQ